MYTSRIGDGPVEMGASIEAASPLSEGRYQLRAILGSGGMATVYRGYDSRLRVPRAIKILAPTFWSRAKVRARFEAEARTMALLDHRNIVRVYDVGIDGNRAYIVMELVDGGCLTDRVEQLGALPPRLAMDVTIDVLKALDAAHQAGVIHRDIKPHNVLITQNEEVRVTDFGIARLMETEDDHLTKTGAIMGTWAYMAPEQRADAKHVDATADVYSVGATLFSLLTGRTPKDLFAADLDASLLEGVDPLVRPFVEKATRYKREERFQTATEMREAAHLVREQLPPPGAETPPLSLSPEHLEELGESKDALPSFGTMVPDAADAALLESAEPAGATAFDSLNDDPEEQAPAAEEQGLSNATDMHGFDTHADVAEVPVAAPPPRSRKKWAVVGGVAMLIGVAGVLLTITPPGDPIEAAPIEATRNVQTPPPEPMAFVEPPVVGPESDQATVELTPNPAEVPLAAQPAPEVKQPPQTKTVTVAPPKAAPATEPKAKPEPAKVEEPAAATSSTPTTEPAKAAPVEATVPTLRHSRIKEASLGDTLRFSANIEGSSQYSQVTLYYKPTGSIKLESKPMFKSGGRFSTTLSVGDQFSGGIDYFIDARGDDPRIKLLKSGSGFKPHRITIN